MKSFIRICILGLICLLLIGCVTQSPTVRYQREHQYREFDGWNAWNKNYEKKEKKKVKGPIKNKYD